MSDYHILREAADGKTIQVVFHFTVPTSGTNSASLPWSDAVRINNFNKDEAGVEVPIFSVLPTYHPANFPGGIEAAEATLIGDGEVIEEIKTIRFSSINLTAAEKKGEIENGNGNDWPGYNSYKTELFNDLQKQLDWTGFRSDVA